LKACPCSRTRDPNRQCCGLAGSARGGTGPSRGQSSNRAAPAEARGPPQPPNRPQSLREVLSSRRMESLAGWTCKRSSVSPIMSKFGAVHDLFTLSMGVPHPPCPPQRFKPLSSHRTRASRPYRPRVASSLPPGPPRARPLTASPYTQQARSPRPTVPSTAGAARAPATRARSRSSKARTNLLIWPRISRTPYTLNSEPQTLNPKPEDFIPKP
jgi:hypothetical protein